jgi:hypothetical protein
MRAVPVNFGEKAVNFDLVGRQMNGNLVCRGRSERKVSRPTGTSHRMFQLVGFFIGSVEFVGVDWSTDKSETPSNDKEGQRK